MVEENNFAEKDVKVNVNNIIFSSEAPTSINGIV